MYACLSGVIELIVAYNEQHNAECFGSWTFVSCNCMYGLTLNSQQLRTKVLALLDSRSVNLNAYYTIDILSFILLVLKIIHYTVLNG